MLVQGEEWGAGTPFLYFTDHREPRLAQAVCEGRRQEFAAFGWRPEEIPDPQAPATFARSKLNWSEISESPHLELLAWHRQLIRLRRLEPALKDGRLDLVRAQWDEQAHWLTVERGPITTACNFAAAPQRVPLRAGQQGALMISEAGIAAGDGFVELPPDSVAIVKRVEIS
jgi:maltooligosyltrehalose trehalohydrolase